MIPALDAIMAAIAVVLVIASALLVALEWERGEESPGRSGSGVVESEGNEDVVVSIDRDRTGGL